MQSRKLWNASLFSVFCVLLLTWPGRVAWSQSARTIKIVVPFPAGGNTDTLARLLAEQIGRAHGPTMVIENRPGAGAVIGTEAAARAAPDGNTVLIAANSFVLNAYLRKVSYDPLISFEPICYIASVPSAIVVNSSSPYYTLDDLFHAARAKPGDLSLAGTPFSLIVAETLKRAAKVDIAAVPYSGNAPAITALLGEHVTSVLTDYAVVAEQLKAGKLRALAAASLTRIAQLPNVQTVAEAGYGDFETDVWNALFVPAKTPKEAVSQLVGWVTGAIQVPEFRAKLIVQGFNPVGMCGADFATYLRKQYDAYGRIVREANIKAE